jgi:hypothetical protein
MPVSRGLDEIRMSAPVEKGWTPSVADVVLSRSAESGAPVEFIAASAPPRPCVIHFTGLPVPVDQGLGGEFAIALEAGDPARCAQSALPTLLEKVEKLPARLRVSPPALPRKLPVEPVVSALLAPHLRLHPGDSIASLENAHGTGLQRACLALFAIGAPC